jgi:hypothetical protein
VSIAPLPGEVHPAVLAAVALAPPLLLWVVLAARQAWRRDPDRSRRQGQRALQRLTQRCRGRAPSRFELETWRELCVQTWGLAQSVPRVAAMTAAMPPEADPAAWALLWNEAELALYSARSPLPSDWTERARSRAEALPPWPAMPWLPIRRAHWLPPVSTAWVAAVLAAAGLMGSLRASAPAAERSARLQQIAQQPGDWAAHQQLAVSYAHEEKWDLAAGHWTAAFLLNPAPPAVAAGFRLGLEKWDGVDPRLTRLASGRGTGGLAARLSAARWEALLGWGAVIGALGLGALVLSRYVRRRRAYLGTGLGLVFGAGAALAAATVALGVYGPLASPRAALVLRRAEVRSIPSDLVAKESATTLPAGAVVMVVRSFFGWDQIVLEGGSVGWARTDSLLWVYRHRDDAVPAREMQ